MCVCVCVCVYKQDVKQSQFLSEIKPGLNSVFLLVGWLLYQSMSYYLPTAGARIV